MRTFIAVILLSLLTSLSPQAQELILPATQTSYEDLTVADERCLVAFVTDTDGDESGPSNTVCRETPTTWEWQAPTENVDGSPIPIDGLASYRLLFSTPQQVPGPVTNLVTGTWDITTLPDTSPMTITIESFLSQGASGGAGNVNATQPAGVVSGDGLLFLVAADDVDLFVDTQSFTLDVEGANAPNSHMLAALSREADGTEADPVPFDRTGGTERWSGTFLRLSGQKAEPFIGAKSTVQFGTLTAATPSPTLDMPSVVATDDNSLIIHVFGLSSAVSDDTSNIPDLSGMLDRNSEGPEFIMVATQASPGAGVATSGPTLTYNAPAGNSVPYGMYTIEVLPAAAGGGISVSVGVISETDSAISIESGKQVVIGIAPETDLAQSVSTSVAVGVQQAEESDVSLPLSTTKARAVAQVTEADNSLPVSQLAQNNIATAQESDASLPIGKLKSESIGTAAETDVGFSIVSAKNQIIGTVLESDASESFSLLKTKALGVVLELDQAIGLLIGGSLLVGLIQELDSAQLIGRAKSLSLNLVNEIDSSEPITSVISTVIPVGAVTTLESTLQILSAKAASVGLVTVSNSALSIAGGISGSATLDSISEQIRQFRDAIEPDITLIKQILANGSTSTEISSTECEVTVYDSDDDSGNVVGVWRIDGDDRTRLQ